MDGQSDSNPIPTFSALTIRGSPSEDQYDFDPDNLSSSGQEILQTFVENRLHKENDVLFYKETKTLCVVNLRNSDRPQIIIRKNENVRGKKRHAEQVVKEYFDKNQQQITSMKMFISASPCHDCSEIIKQMKYALEGNFQLIFSALYNIERGSCQERTCTCLKYNLRNSQSNKEGLQNLNKNEIRMSTFSAQDWTELIDLLGHHDKAALKKLYTDNKCYRDVEDVMMEKDLKSVLESYPAGDLSNSQHLGHVAIPNHPASQPYPQQHLQGQIQRGVMPQFQPAQWGRQSPSHVNQDAMPQASQQSMQAMGQPRQKQKHRMVAAVNQQQQNTMQSTHTNLNPVSVFSPQGQHGEGGGQQSQSINYMPIPPAGDLNNFHHSGNTPSPVNQDAQASQQQQQQRQEQHLPPPPQSMQAMGQPQQQQNDRMTAAVNQQGGTGTAGGTLSLPTTTTSSSKT